MNAVISCQRDVKSAGGWLPFRLPLLNLVSKKIVGRTGFEPVTSSVGVGECPKAQLTMQARIDVGFARELVEHDAAVLGLEGPSELVREGLRLLHRRAREMDLAAAYDEFYAGETAPLPAGVVAADAD